MAKLYYFNQLIESIFQTGIPLNHIHQRFKQKALHSHRKSALKQTLVILSPGFPENEADSTCLTAQQLFVRSINKQFPTLEIIVLAFQYPYTHFPYRWFANRVIPFNGQNKGNIRRIMVWYKVWVSLKKLRKQHHIIGLLSFWCTECAFVGNYFARLYGLRHYCWILGQDARRSNKFVAFIHPKPDSLVAMSAFLAKEFNRNHHIFPAHVIPNGVAAEFFGPAAIERDIDILGAGSLIPLKRYDLFVRLIKEITKHLPGIKTAICGKGPEETSLQDLIKELNLENNVLLMGEMPHRQVLELMQRSKILLHTSSYEGFSTVCLEALYAGSHVVSFCSPHTEKINHWHLVESKEEMFNETFRLLLDDKTEFEPVMAFSMDDSARSMMQLFGL